MQQSFSCKLCSAQKSHFPWPWKFRSRPAAMRFCQVWTAYLKVDFWLLLFYPFVGCRRYFPLLERKCMSTSPKTWRVMASRLVREEVCWDSFSQGLIALTRSVRCFGTAWNCPALPFQADDTVWKVIWRWFCIFYYIALLSMTVPQTHKSY